VGTKTPSEKTMAVEDTMKRMGDKHILPVEAEPHNSSTKTIEKQKAPKQVKRSSSSHSSSTGLAPVTSAPPAPAAAPPRESIKAPSSIRTTTPTVSQSSIPLPPPLPLPPSQGIGAHKKWYSPPPSLRPSPLHISVNTPSPSAESVVLTAHKNDRRAPVVVASSVAQEHDKAATPGTAKHVRKVRFGNTTRINLATPAHSLMRVENKAPNALATTSNMSSRPNPLANLKRPNHLNPVKRPLAPMRVPSDSIPGSKPAPSGQTRPVNAARDALIVSRSIVVSY